VKAVKQEDNGPGPPVIVMTHGAQPDLKPAERYHRDPDFI
jgi:hypothetical protein